MWEWMNEIAKFVRWILGRYRQAQLWHMGGAADDSDPTPSALSS
jgi:hypothetical protein